MVVVVSVSGPLVAVGCATHHTATSINLPEVRSGLRDSNGGGTSAHSGAVHAGKPRGVQKRRVCGAMTEVMCEQCRPSVQV